MASPGVAISNAGRRGAAVVTDPDANKVLPFPQPARPLVPARPGTPDGARLARPKSVWSYVVCGEIGSGGMATVHLGLCVGPSGIRRPIAMKRIRAGLPKAPQLQAALRSEALLGTHIRHPNVVPVLDLVEADGDLFLVMDHIVGETLGSLLKAAEQPPVPIALAIISGVLRGLHAAHVATDSESRPLNIVHRDVSPQNVLIGADGIARIIDFGVAKTTASDPTSVGYVKGKVGYFAPEQFFREPLDARTDVFAAGIVLWESLAGCRLFRRRNPLEDVLQLATHKLRPASAYNPRVDKRLDAVLARALESARDRRFDTAEQFAEALENVVRPSSPSEVARYLEGRLGPAIEMQRARLRELLSKTERVGAAGAPARRAGVEPRLLRSWEEDVTVVSEEKPGELDGDWANGHDFEAETTFRLPSVAPPPPRTVAAKPSGPVAALSLARQKLAVGPSSSGQQRLQAARRSPFTSRPPEPEEPSEHVQFMRGRVPPAPAARRKPRLPASVILPPVGLVLLACLLAFAITSRPFKAWTQRTLVPSARMPTATTPPRGVAGAVLRSEFKPLAPASGFEVVTGPSAEASGARALAPTPVASDVAARASAPLADEPRRKPAAEALVKRTQPARPARGGGVRRKAPGRLSCDPPYRYDALGIKRMKRECL